jgi:hypothetical protein
MAIDQVKRLRKQSSNPGCPISHTFFVGDVGSHERRSSLVTVEETLIPLQDCNRFHVKSLWKQVDQVNRLQKVTVL